MLTEKMVLKSSDGHRYRLLIRNSSGGIVVPCDNYGLPFERNHAWLEQCVAADLPESSKFLLSEEDIPEWKKKERDWRWTLIRELADDKHLKNVAARRALPRMQNDYLCTRHRRRCGRVCFRQ